MIPIKRHHFFPNHITGNKQGNIPLSGPSITCLIFCLLILSLSISKMRSNRSGANRWELTSGHTLAHVCVHSNTHTRICRSSSQISTTLKSTGGKKGIKPIPPEGSCGRFFFSHCKTLSILYYLHKILV